MRPCGCSRQLSASMRHRWCSGSIEWSRGGSSHSRNQTTRILSKCTAQTFSIQPKQTNDSRSSAGQVPSLALSMQLEHYTAEVPSVRARACARTRACVCVRACAYLRTRMCARARVCVCVLVCSCVCARMLAGGRGLRASRFRC